LRVLVFHGGGSLGAYEPGVFHILYYWIRKDIKENENKTIFDIIAGTSIGVVNASIIINHFLENKEINENNKDHNKNIHYWEFAHEKLIHFWMTVSSPYLYYDFWTKILVNNRDNTRDLLSDIFPNFKDLLLSG
jgi:NTE family protein